MSAIHGWKALVLVLCTLAAAISLGWPRNPPRNGMKISAGPIKQMNAHQILGSFRLSASPSRNAILSGGTGGACLVANLNQVNAKRGKPRIPFCTQRSDCVPGTIGGEISYCDGRAGKPGECWVKPSGPPSALCNRSLDYSPLRIWSPSQDYNTPKDGPYLVPPEYRGVKWRVTACLNEIDPTTGKDYVPGSGKSCGEGGGMNDFGPPALVQ